MTKRFDWQKARHDTKSKRSLSDEQDFLAGDAASWWLDRHGDKRPSQPPKPKKRRRAKYEPRPMAQVSSRTSD
jgi:hypothetical protein